jgi:hypothetical protein
VKKGETFVSPRVTVVAEAGIDANDSRTPLAKTAGTTKAPRLKRDIFWGYINETFFLESTKLKRVIKVRLIARTRRA